MKLGANSILEAVKMMKSLVGHTAKRVLILVAAVGALGGATALAGSRATPQPHTAAAGRPQCPHKPLDPRSALPLRADALAPATNAALRYFHDRHEGIAGVSGAIAETATRQPAPARATARALCGDQVARRTVTVTVRLPQPPNEQSASLALGVVLVSHFANGYRVWFEVH